MSAPCVVVGSGWSSGGHGQWLVAWLLERSWCPGMLLKACCLLTWLQSPGLLCKVRLFASVSMVIVHGAKASGWGEGSAF